MASNNPSTTEDQVSIAVLFGPLKAVLDNLLQQNQQLREEIDRLKQQHQDSITEERRIQSEMSAIQMQHQCLLEQLEQLNDLYRICSHELNQQARTTDDQPAPRWSQQGMTIAGGNGQGNELNQLTYPCAIAIGEGGKIYIADHGNCRIMEWESNVRNSRVVFDGQTEGDGICCPRDVIIDSRMNSLIFSDWMSRRVMRYSFDDHTHRNVITPIDCNHLFMDRDGSLYVSDWQRNEVKRWRAGETEGTVIAGGHGKGNHLNQLDQPTFLFVDDQCTVYISDVGNHRVMKWMKNAREGILVAGGNGQGNHLRQLERPQGIFVDSSSRIYIADQGNHRIIRWDTDAHEGIIIIGGTGQGQDDHHLHDPTGLAFDSQGHLYVVDQENHRIQKYDIVLS